MRETAIAASLYFVFFCAFTWPWIAHFDTSYFASTIDGQQNVWTIWWVNKAVTGLHQLPWHTSYLHYPYGSSLLGPPNPFNGFVGIPLLRIFSLVQTFNLLMIFSFVAGGVTAFWLCRFVTNKFVPSLIGGFIFTFSSYHLAQAVNHLQLVSLEWIPLFVLLWWKLLEHPRARLAVGAAVVLSLVLLCDYYYFLYTVAAAILIAAYLAYKRAIPPWRERSTYRPLALFGVVAFVLCAPLPLALLKEDHSDPLVGAHNALQHSTDLLMPFIDGGLWRFRSITSGYSSHLPLGIDATGSTVYLGISVIALICIALVKRNKLHPHTWFWLGLSFVFALFSLGPCLMVWGHTIQAAVLPYTVLEHVVPGLSLSGIPSRMMVMCTLGIAVVSAIVLSTLDLGQRKGRAILALFFVVLVFEMWPLRLPMLPASHPKYVDAIAALPAGGVLDLATPSAAGPMFEQIRHDHPVAFGYLARYPSSVLRKDSKFKKLIAAGGFDQLCQAYKIRYVVTTVQDTQQNRAMTSLRVVYRDDQALVYDVKNAPGC